MLVRFASRRTAWEDTPTDELVRVEFQDRQTGKVDLTPSVYLAEENRMTQLAAEHGATSGMKPQTFVYGTLGHATQVRQCKTDPEYFAYACSVHHEMSFPSEEALRTYVEDGRHHWKHPLRVVKSDVLAYVRQTVGQGDREWAAALSTERCSAWAKDAR